MNASKDDTVDYVVTWAEVHRDTKLLARKLIKTGTWKGIIAITGGG
jgi:xanthine phosphoribosyltransferase